MAKRGEGGNLLQAVKAGDIVECRRLLLESMEKNKGDKDKEEDDYVVEIHEKDCSYGWSSILWASHNGRVDIAELLLSNGANIHDKDISGFSPIITASRRGHVDTVELLLSNGANIHDRNNTGISSIAWASINGHVDVVDLILSNGASIHDIDYYGNFSLFFVLPRNHTRVLYHLRKWPTTMAIIMLQELALIYIIDSESVIDLHQYLGRPDDCTKSDSEEDYRKDKEGSL